MHWKEFWNGKQNCGHRYQDEEYLKKVANEKSYHLNGGESLLDFGCGSADILCYYAKDYRHVVAADFSTYLLNVARKRLDDKGLNNVLLLNEDDKTIWSKLEQSFDRITLNMVVQYFDNTQIESFVRNAINHLNKGGKLIIFEVIDPRLFILFRLGVLGESKISGFKLVFNIIKYVASKLIRILKCMPSEEIGYAQYPDVFRYVAEKFNLKLEFSCSMFLEYRYHVIISN